MSALVSKATVTSVGLLCKAFLNIGYCSSVTVTGFDNLRDALESEDRQNGRGIITVANHISTLDDPLVWGILPMRFFLSPSMMTRWTLGASDIMFTNPLFSFFFSKGQVIETFRGNGIFQPALDEAIHKLNNGAWIHLFGEGKVNQLVFNPRSDPAELLRFKWGVGRILMETARPPMVIPMWLSGFDHLMPEHRPSPWKFLPRPRIDLGVTFGKLIDLGEVRASLGQAVSAGTIPQLPESSHGGRTDPKRPIDENASAKATGAWLRDTIPQLEEDWSVEEVARVRSAVTALLQEHVEALGREVLRAQGKRSTSNS